MTQLTIQGAQFEIATPYAEGHVLNLAEASTLNQTYLENIRNNVAGKIKAAKEAFVKNGGAEDAFSIDTYKVADTSEGAAEGATVTLRSVLDAYASTYAFGVKSASVREPVDPVAREARAIAKGIIAAKLKEAKSKRSDIADEVYEAAVNKLAGTDDVQKEAKRRVKAAEGLGLAELGIELGDSGNESTAG